jgi:plasmid maintenance system antidote protein VapI
MSRLIKESITLPQIASMAHVSPQEVWRVIAGGVTENRELARVMARYAGSTPENFMQHSRGRLRSGWLQWCAEAVGISLNHAWRIVSQRRQVKHSTAEKLAAFTGIEAMHWVAPETYGNWLMDITAEAGTREAEKPEKEAV